MTSSLLDRKPECGHRIARNLDKDSLPNTEAVNSTEFTASYGSSKNRSLWAKGDLNPHVPKDTGT